MSLTQQDLSQIRQLMREEVEAVVRPIVRYEVDMVVTERLRPVESEVKALRNDVKELYGIVLLANG